MYYNSCCMIPHVGSNLSFLILNDLMATPKPELSCEAPNPVYFLDRVAINSL